jgi:hypothetical protein
MTGGWGGITAMFRSDSTRNEFTQIKDEILDDSESFYQEESHQTVEMSELPR